jgi:RHS repeat-associated protein
VEYTHNANGDLVSDGLRTYSYDAEGRLASVTTGATDTSPTTRYAHNALGQRVFKTEPLYPPAQGEEADAGFMQSLIAFLNRLWAPGASDAERLGTAFVYDEQGSLIAEVGMGGAHSSGSTQYIYLPTANGPMPIAAVINGALYAVHSDHLNTPRRLTNASGQAVWQWAYSAFGDEEPTTAKNRFANLDVTPNPGTSGISDVVYNIGFMGMYRDKESGLAQNWDRYFDKRTGRYTQPDRIGLDGGPNRYPYANLNPLRYTDPDGRLAFVLPAAPSIGGWIAGGVGAATGAVLGWNLFGPMFQDKTPNTGEPGSWHTNPGDGKPGSGQERLYGPNGKPEVDIDWHPDHGAGKPHGHNWDNGRRGPGVPLSPWPRGRIINGCSAQ